MEFQSILLIIILTSNNIPNDVEEELVMKRIMISSLNITPKITFIILSSIQSKPTIIFLWQHLYDEYRPLFISNRIMASVHNIEELRPRNEMTPVLSWRPVQSRTYTYKRRRWRSYAWTSRNQVTMLTPSVKTAVYGDPHSPVHSSATTMNDE